MTDRRRPCPARPAERWRAGWRAGARAFALLAFGAAFHVGLGLAPGQARAAPSQAAEVDDQSRWRALADPVFEPVTLDPRTPRSAVYSAVAQDRDGFLWIGTLDGLLRWDGRRTQAYRRADAPGSLPDNWVQTLHVDAAGELWVGMAVGGLARLDRATDRFVSLPAAGEASGFSSITGLQDDGQGGLWIATGAGLAHRAAGQDAPVAVPVPLLAGDRPIGVAAVLARDGVLWIGSRRGLVRSTDQGATWATVPLPSRDGVAPQVTCLFQDSGGRVWIGTSLHGSFVMPPGGSPQALEADPAAVASAHPEGQPAPPRRVSAMAEPRPGEVWIAHYLGGLVVADAASGRMRRIVHDPSLPNGLGSGEIWSLFADRSGLLWVGSNQWLRHDPSQQAVFTAFGRVGRSRGMGDANVSCLSVAPDGRVWAGLGTQGLELLDPLRGRVAAIRPLADAPGRLPASRVMSVLARRSGDVLVGTRAGLYRVEPASQAVSRVPALPVAANVSVLLEAGSDLWVGTNEGVWRLRSNDLLAPAADRFDGMEDRRVTALATAPDGSLWVGTQTGLEWLDPASGRAVRQAALGGPAGYVAALHVDARGRLWVAVLGGGVQLLDEGAGGSGRPGRWQRIDHARGLPNDNANMLLPDRRGRLWVSTDDGLAVIDTDKLTAEALRAAEGVALPTYWTGAGSVTPEGELMFGAEGGLTVVQPDRLRPWHWQAPVVVSALRVDGEAQPPGALRRLPDGLQLAGAQLHSLSVEFAALDLSAPERNRYAYRLEGLDEQWIEADAVDPRAVYTYLPVGHHRLLLRGSNRRGDWTEPPLALRFEVLPAWWQTTAFRLAMALLAAALLAAAVQARTLVLRRRQRALEQLVAERTAELEQSRALLQRMAYADPLTGLPNRRLFQAHFRLLMAQAQRRRSGFALLLVDLDEFKSVNDRHGHTVGDALLIELARRLTDVPGLAHRPTFGEPGGPGDAAGELRDELPDGLPGEVDEGPPEALPPGGAAVLRAGDCVARLGGDEFAILLAEGAPSAVEAVCKRLLQRLAEPLLHEGRSHDLRASIGAASYPLHGRTEDALYQAADAALYQAKAAGRNTWRSYSGSLAHPHDATQDLRQ